MFDLAEGLEEPVQLLYIVTLLGFAAFGAYLTIRQVLVRRDLEEAAKVLGERIRSGDGNSEVRHHTTSDHMPSRDEIVRAGDDTVFGPPRA